MNWIFTTAIVIILLIAGFMLFFFMPKPTVFFDPYKDVTDILTPQYDAIKKESLQDCITPVIPIYGFGDAKTSKYPDILSIVKTVPGIRLAGIINIKPKFQQVKEYGLAALANRTVRHFYTIQESAGHKSGIWIDGEKKFFDTKGYVCGDMSREHSLFNKDKERAATVLFLDVDRDQSMGNSPNIDINKDEILKMFVMVDKYDPDDDPDENNEKEIEETRLTEDPSE
jgi:hypothetical protein